MKALARWSTAAIVLAVLAGTVLLVGMLPPLGFVAWLVPIAVGVSIRRENPRNANALYVLGVVLAVLLFLVWFGMGDRVYSGYPDI